MSNEKVNVEEPPDYYEEGDGEYDDGAEFDAPEDAYDDPNILYDDTTVNAADQPQQDYYDNYSAGGGTDQGQAYQDWYYDDDGNPYYADYYDGDDAQTGNRTSGNATYDNDYWYDDWDGDHQDVSVDTGEDDDTVAYQTPVESSGDTTGPSPAKSSNEKSSKEKSSQEKSSSSGKKEAEKKNVKPVELSKRSFRWFQRKVLAQQIPNSEENIRRKRLLEKCQMVRKVSKPVVTLLGAKSKTVRSIDSAGKVAPDTKKGSKQSLLEGDGEDEKVASGEDDGDDTECSRRTFRDYNEREWAIKNTVDFLTTQGCTSSSSRSYRSSLRAAREEADFRLGIYEHQLQRRRKAIGNSAGAPEITAALRRHAERAVWRAVIDNTKPRYPLPRFILPRHRYLKKVQAQFIGPGSYEVDVLEKQVKARRLRMPSTWATCTARFPKEKDGGDGESEGKGGTGTTTAGGGTTLRDPWIEYDKANYRHKYPGTYIPFESTPKNFRKGLLEVGSRIPPNAYNIKSPMEEYIKKQTSTRGPYDCYTPSRKVIPYGYYKSQNDDEQGRLGPGSYEIRTSLVKEMHDSYNVFKGMFGKADRSKMFGFKAAFDNPLWPKEDESMPAVGQYDPDTGVIGQDQEQNIAPFKTQTGLKKREIKKPDLVAPDYYFFGTGCTWTVPPRGANLASVFRSKTPQIMSNKLHHVRKERNKSSNRKLDLEGLGQGYLLEEHYAYDKPVKNTYVLEDCKDPNLMPKGGPRVDPFAIPGSGVVGLGLGACCGGEIIDKRRGRGNCCGC